jgi:gamma-glutamyltranspeptidase/glutathione hydrolase
LKIRVLCWSRFWKSRSWIIIKEYAKERRGLINPDAAGIYQAGKESNGGTIYLTVADKDGNMVSLIQSNYRGMGSGMVPPKLGLC